MKINYNINIDYSEKIKINRIFAFIITIIILRTVAHYFSGISLFFGDLILAIYFVRFIKISKTTSKVDVNDLTITYKIFSIDCILLLLFYLFTDSFEILSSYWITFDFGFLSNLSSVILAPIWEEIFFRGVFVTFLKKKTNRKLILYLVPALLFGVLHFSIAIPSVILGLIFTHAYIKHENLLVNMILHGTWNLLMILKVKFVIAGFGLNFMNFYFIGLVGLGIYNRISKRKKKRLNDVVI